MKKKLSAIDAFMALPDEEKERQLKEFDREFVGDEFKPLTAKQRAQWERAKRKPGRPVRGAGAKVISLSVEKQLLQKADEEAKRRHISRAQFFEMGIKQLLAAGR